MQTSMLCCRRHRTMPFSAPSGPLDQLCCGVLGAFNEMFSVVCGVQVRTTVSDFAVFIAIMICTGVDAWFGLNTPKLLVPETFTVS